LGRIDYQVKLRGFRIELEEIESTLDRHPAIRQSLVMVREDKPGFKQLVAYVVPEAGEVLQAADLRQHAKQSLPEFMVPSSIVFLDAFPITLNGKIDRKALPVPDVSSADVKREFVAPRDPLEQALAHTWSKVLKAKQVGVQDNFFELGGHSLAAVRLLSEIQKQTGRLLPLATLFQASTVEAMAEILRKDGWAPSWSSLVPVQPLGSKPPLFLIHGAEGNVLLYRQMAQYLGSDQPVYGLQSQGLNGDGRFDTTVPGMALEYIKEVQIVQPHGPYFLGGYCLGGIIAFEMAQQLKAIGEQVELVIMLDTYNVGAVSRSILLRTPLHFLQNLWFHGANVLSIQTAKDRRKFLSEKLDIELTRLGIRLQAMYQGLLRLGRKDSQSSYPHLMLKKINDEAALRYLPGSYDGRVAVIRPKAYFSGLTSPSLGWNEVVRNGPEIYELPVYPKGMLIEPFCRSLGETLKQCLQGT
jgi:thioesterase domain-containing protein/acyl carrier protein